MKTTFLYIIVFIISVIFLAHSIQKRYDTEEERQKLIHELAMSSFENGYLSGFNNCKKDSMLFIESSFQNDSIIMASIIYR